MTIATASGLALVLVTHVAAGSSLAATPAGVTRPNQGTQATTPTTPAGSSPPSNSTSTTAGREADEVQPVPSSNTATARSR